jgi:hypothetical protein
VTAVTDASKVMDRAAGLAHVREKMVRKQVETLDLVCQHESGIDISKG